MNRMPVKIKGKITINDPLLPVNELKNIAATKKDAQNRSPPINSRFHATISIIIKTRTGILWIKNPAVLRIKVSLPSKESKENISINPIARMARILGVQNNVFSNMAKLIRDLKKLKLLLSGK